MAERPDAQPADSRELPDREKVIGHGGIVDSAAGDSTKWIRDRFKK